MNIEEAITRARDNEDYCRGLHRLQLEDEYQKALEEHEVLVIQIRGCGNTYPLERAIEIQEQHLEIERRLPDVSDEEWEEYCCLTDLLGIMLDNI